MAFLGDFSVSSSPSSNSVVPGGSVNYTVSTTAFLGFSGSIALSASGLPTGATASFSPATVTGAGTDSHAYGGGRERSDQHRLCGARDSHGECGSGWRGGEGELQQCQRADEYDNPNAARTGAYQISGTGSRRQCEPDGCGEHGFQWDIHAGEQFERELCEVHGHGNGVHDNGDAGSGNGRVSASTSEWHSGRAALSQSSRFIRRGGLFRRTRMRKAPR